MEIIKKKSYATKFHSNHGENIVLLEDCTVAYRKKSFTNALAFSDKALLPGEIFLVEVEKNERGWSGYMRMGLTQLDPEVLSEKRGYLPRCAVPNLTTMNNSWACTITEDNEFGSDSVSSFIVGEPCMSSTSKQYIGETVYTPRGTISRNVFLPSSISEYNDILPMDVGSRIGVFYLPMKNSRQGDMAEMYFVINGEIKGPFSKNIPYKEKPLFAVIDVYARTKQVRIIQLYGVSSLQNACRLAILQHMSSSEVYALPLPKTLKDFILYNDYKCTDN